MKVKRQTIRNDKGETLYLADIDGQICGIYARSPRRAVVKLREWFKDIPLYVVQLKIIGDSPTPSEGEGQ